MNGYFSSKYFLLLTTTLFLASTQVQAVDDTDYSDALAFGFHGRQSQKNCYRSSAKSYKPYRVQETNTPEVSENDLTLQLDVVSRQVYNSMSEEGKTKARQLAGDNYRFNKNYAVRVAAEMMQDKHHEWNTQQSQQGGNRNGRS